MLANLPTTVRKMLLCIFNGCCFQFSCHGVVPTVEKTENGYLTDNLVDLSVRIIYFNSVKSSSVTAFGTVAAAWATRSAARSASVNKGLISYSNAASIFPLLHHLIRHRQWCNQNLLSWLLNYLPVLNWINHISSNSSRYRSSVRYVS